MEPKKIIESVMLPCCLLLLADCSITSGLQRQQITAHLAQLAGSERQEQISDNRPQSVQLRQNSSSVYFVPAETLEDGERVLSLRIEEVSVVAKVRTLPERKGRVTLDFMVTLPKALLGKSRSVIITPVLHKLDCRMELEDLVIRGGRFSRLQERDYWQYETYVERFRPDPAGCEAAFNRFVKFPCPEDTRLDSVIERHGMMVYYYSEEVETDETTKCMSVTLEGVVLGLDDTTYRLPSSDTLVYAISSMLSFADTLPRYRIEKIDGMDATKPDTTYMRGVELLRKCKYAEALYVLNDYNDLNTAVAHLSLGHDERALEILTLLPQNAVVEYLSAIACSRLGRKEEGLEHYLEACRLDERMEHRGNLDPEITELRKD